MYAKNVSVLAHALYCDDLDFIMYCMNFNELPAQFIVSFFFLFCCCRRRCCFSPLPFYPAIRFGDDFLLLLLLQLLLLLLLLFLPLEFFSHCAQFFFPNSLQIKIYTWTIAWIACEECKSGWIQSNFETNKNKIISFLSSVFTNYLTLFLLFLQIFKNFNRMNMYLLIIYLSFLFESNIIEI